jgi:hypothetical protein
MMQGGALEHIPDLGGDVWYGAQWNWAGMWLYDAKTNTWKDLKPNGGVNVYHTKGFPRAEVVTAYDAKHKVLVAQSGKNTYHYDVATNTWEHVLKDTEPMPAGHDARTPFYYDPVGETCLLFDRRDGAMWSYSTPKKAWTKLTPKGPKPPTHRAIAYFDPARNVFVVNAGETTWVYRRRARAESDYGSRWPGCAGEALRHHRGSAFGAIQGGLGSRDGVGISEGN